MIGVVKTTNDLTSVKSRATQKEIMKRDITIVDEGECSIRLTLWGAEVQKGYFFNYIIQNETVFL